MVNIDFNKIMNDTKVWFNNSMDKVKNMFIKPTDQSAQANTVNPIARSAAINAQRVKHKDKFDFNKWLKELPDKMKLWPEKIKAWFIDLPNKINRLVEKVKNYPPDKQAAVGSIATGSLLVFISLILFII